MEQKQNGPRLGDNKMKTMPVGKLLFNMALPLVLSMLVQAAVRAAAGGVFTEPYRQCQRGLVVIPYCRDRQLDRNTDIVCTNLPKQD